MNAFKIKEVQELPKSTSDVGKTTKAFENAKNEVRSPRHITTINEGLAGQTYPGTNVEYRKHTFTLNGEKVEGVFPKFDSKFDTMLPRDLRNASDTEQFKYCTQKLACFRTRSSVLSASLILVRVSRSSALPALLPSAVFTR